MYFIFRDAKMGDTGQNAKIIFFLAYQVFFVSLVQVILHVYVEEPD